MGIYTYIYVGIWWFPGILDVWVNVLTYWKLYFWLEVTQ